MDNPKTKKEVKKNEKSKNEIEEHLEASDNSLHSLPYVISNQVYKFFPILFGQNFFIILQCLIKFLGKQFL